MGAASAAIHQLRYAIGYGDAAPHALATHAHDYLSLVLPAVITASAIALAGALIRAARAHMPAESDETGAISRFRHSRWSFLGLWAGCSLALALIYATQETLEGSGALAGSGWIGLALALPVGALVATALRGASAAEAPPAAAPFRIPSVVAAIPVALHPASPPALLAVRKPNQRGPPLPLVV